MAPPRTLLLVLAGGAGGRLESLTDDRAKPAVPWGGSYRLVDVALSNAANAGLQDVWLVQQFHPASLSDHLANGRPWDLDRTAGGLLVLPPHLGDEKGGWHGGTADALWRKGDLVRQFDPEVLLVASADALYRLDYDDVARAHLDGGAAATFVTSRVPAQDASRYGVVRVEGDRVVDYAYKPDEPATDVATTEVFAFRAREVLDRLDALAADADEDGLTDLGDALLPGLVDDGEVRALPQPGYWRDVGTVDAYWDSHAELLGDEPPFVPDDPTWPLRTRRTSHGPARVLDGGGVRRSMLAPGAVVAGEVVRSVLGPGAVVEAGARVEDAVLLPGAVVRAGAHVRRAVLDDGADVAADVGGQDGVALVGRGRRVTRPVPAGGRDPRPADEEQA